MSFAAAHPHPADQADQQVEDAQYYRSVLHELIDMGMDLARVVHGQALLPAGDADAAGDAATAPLQAAAVAFDRISRAVRRTVALARKVAEPLPARHAVTHPDHHRAAARRRILREVEDVIQRTAGVDAEALGAELSERLDAPELEDEIDNRPVAEIIADICRDLGVAVTLGAHPWKRRTPGDVEALCARAAQPPRAAPPLAPAVALPAPGRMEAAADPPSLPRDTDAALLPFAPPFRCR